MPIHWHWKGPGFYVEVNTSDGARHRMQVSEHIHGLVKDSVYVESLPMETKGEGLYIEEEEEA